MNIKLIVYAVAALAALGLLAVIVDRIGDARESKVVARYEKQIAENAAKARAKEDAQRNELHARSQSYENRIAALESSKPATPTIVVRKCPSAPAVPSTAAIAREPLEADPAGLGRENAEDFGKTLAGFAREVQSIAIQCDEVIKAWPK